MDKSPHQLLKHLLLSEDWKKYEEYLAGEKSRLVTQLCNCNEVFDMRYIQGQIRTIDDIFKLKDKLETEMRGQQATLALHN